MKLPIGLMGTALIFWGLQTGYLIYGCAMATVLEGSRFLRQRWEFTPEDFYRIVDICVLIILGMTIYRFSIGTDSMVRWLPIAIFPLLTVQAYSVVQGVDLGALFYVIRLKEKRRPAHNRHIINISYHTLVVVLISASAANLRTPAFYIGLTLCSCWALWPLRSRRYKVMVWALIFVMATIIGWYGQIGLHRLQLWLEGAVADILLQGNLYKDPYQVTTSIGDVGKLKLSNRIIMWVEPETTLKIPQLFHQNTYNTYRSYQAGRWFSPRSPLLPIQKKGATGCWQLGQVDDVGPYQAWISGTLNSEDGVLALPSGVITIEGLEAMELGQTNLGAIRVKGGPKSFYFRINWKNQGARGAPPYLDDLQIPVEYQTIISAVAAELNLNTLSHRQAKKAITDYFSKFSYTLIQKESDVEAMPLETFLRDTHAGHCEYFATATSLLLRAAGIPARYVTGFLVNEYSTLGNCFVLRSRHAHAWSLAYLDGIWQTVDNTPSQWSDLESQKSSYFQFLMDVADYMKYKFDSWWSIKRLSDKQTLLFWLAIALIPLILWRFMRYRRVMVQRGRNEIPPPKNNFWRERYSFDRIDAYVHGLGFGRYNWESYAHWINRLERGGFSDEAIALLKVIVQMHYRMCFHLPGITSEEERWLAENVETWISSIKDNFFE